MHAKKTAFIVEHDFIMAAYLADRVIVLRGATLQKGLRARPNDVALGCGPVYRRMGQGRSLSYACVRVVRSMAQGYAECQLQLLDVH